MADRNFTQKMFTLHNYPVLLDCNFIVDSDNANGLGIRSLKGPGIKAVYMHVSAPSLLDPFAVLGASSVSNTGSSVLTGDLGIYPGTSITGFPPGTFTGTEHIADSVAAAAQAKALAVYTTFAAHASTTIASALDGQTLSAGYYSFASGAATLATSAPGTLTLNGSATDIFVIKTASTLTTGAGGAATITLTGGAIADNVYFIVGSSATLNVTAGTHRGNVIAQASITNGAGDVQGRLVALTGAVTISSASTIEVQLPTPAFIAPGNPNPEAGTAIVFLQDNYMRYFGGFSGFISPVSGSALTSGLTIGRAYVIASLGASTAAQFQAAGLPIGTTAAVGVAFIATATSIAGGATVKVTASSLISSIELVGDPTLTLTFKDTPAAGRGAYLIVKFMASGVMTQPADESICEMAFYLSNSSLIVQGE